MALLQLAENDFSHLAEDSNPLENYIFIPAGMYGQTQDNYVRADFFDGLPDDEFNAVITSLAPYQNTGMSGVLDTAVSFIPGVGPVAAGGVKIAQKLIQGRKDRQAAGTDNPALKGGPKMGGGNLIQKIKTGIAKVKAAGSPNQEKNLPIDIQGNVGGTSFDLTTGQTETTQNFLTKYKKPLLIVGGLGLGFLLYKTLGKRK
jgi:hypothetical protein